MIWQHGGSKQSVVPISAGDYAVAEPANLRSIQWLTNEAEGNKVNCAFESPMG